MHRLPLLESVWRPKWQEITVTMSKFWSTKVESVCASIQEVVSLLWYFLLARVVTCISWSDLMLIGDVIWLRGKGGKNKGSRFFPSTFFPLWCNLDLEIDFQYLHSSSCIPGKYVSKMLHPKWNHPPFSLCGPFGPLLHIKCTSCLLTRLQSPPIILHLLT